MRLETAVWMGCLRDGGWNRSHAGQSRAFNVITCENIPMFESAESRYPGLGNHGFEPVGQRTIFEVSCLALGVQSALRSAAVGYRV